MSKLEIQYIEDNAHFKPYNIIAEKLNRDPATVKIHIEEKMGLKTDLSGGKPAFDPNKHESITSKEFWPTIVNQFSAEELALFEYHWNKVSEQFGYDILPTEELQMIDMIKIEILMNRNLRKQRDNAEQVRIMQDEIEDEKKKDSAADFGKIANLREQSMVLITSEGALSREYREYQDKKNKIFDALKATRKDRITRIENSKESFLTWISELIDNADLREEIGLHIEKFRMASIDEEIRLSAFHKYMDDKVDRPLLNCDTVTEEDG